MNRGEPDRHLDASDLLFEVGRQMQAVALVTRRHELVPAQQLCECGRLALRVLPVLGLRCDIACHQWDLAYALIQRLLPQIPDRNVGSADGPAVGRASVRPAGHASSRAGLR